MPDYSQGKIYKIVSSQTSMVYVGSTSLPKLCRRMVQHRIDFKCWKEGKKGYYSSFEILQYDDCCIILIEDYPCENKDQLRAQEQHWINEFGNACVNKYKAYTGIKAENRVLYKKIYYEENKEIIAKKHKNYNHENAEKIAEKKKMYRQENAEVIAEYQKKYQQENAESLKEKFNCDCGGRYTRAGKAQHEKSKKHQAFLTTQ